MSGTIQRGRIVAVHGTHCHVSYVPCVEQIGYAPAPFFDHERQDVHMELTALNEQLKDLAQRNQALRGHL